MQSGSPIPAPAPLKSVKERLVASREGQEVIAAKMEAEEDARVPKSKRKKKKRVRDSSGDKFSTAAVEFPTRLVQGHEDGGGANVAAKAMEERMHSGEPFDEYGLASAEGVSGDEGPSHAPSQAIEKLEDVDSAYVALKIKKKHKKRISGDGEANTLAFEPRSQSNGQTLQSQENDMDADIRPTVFKPKKDREDKKRKRHTTADHDGGSEPSSIKKKLRKDDSAQASPNPVTHSLENIVSSPNARDYGKRGHLSLNGPNSPMGAMRTITPDRKAKEKLLLQTILKGRQNHVQQLSEPNGKAAATAEINLRGSSIGYSPDTNATKGPKAETRRRSESERNDLQAISSPPTTSTGFTRDFPPYSDSNEGWETSPGVIRGKVGARLDEDTEENTAFSWKYIASRPQGLQLGDSIFNIVSLTPGKEHKFGLDCRHGLRICSVASGRVDVALGKLDFGIGVGGMWRIKHKESCVAKNNGEQVAVLHLTSIP